MGREQRIAGVDAEPYRLPLTVRDFLLLDEAEAFAGVGQVELIGGEIFKMAPLHRPHARIVPLLSIAFDRALRAIDVPYEVLAEPSTELDSENLPQADLVISDPADEQFVSKSNVRLLVEVAVTSLKHDLGPKLRLYARSGIPEYWVVDVNGRKVIRFHAPAGEEFLESVDIAFGEPVPSATIPGLVVDTARLA